MLWNMGGIFSIALQAHDHISPDVGEYILPMERKHLQLSGSWEELDGCPAHLRGLKKTQCPYPHTEIPQEVFLYWSSYMLLQYFFVYFL